ncbi:glycosyltransferase family 2 protein [Sphingobacterium sp. LRF_L2]|uniref:glycosyltransferase family 2 protein n=1 Tax=Sphingobacterium sp. LRF_L2 TaxID=3369421 RepID=UPI003F5E696E
MNYYFSIIMPVYNSGSFLDAAIQSILDQSFKDFELILVDDGSTDGSGEKCESYADKDSRVKVIRQNNGGICAARNRALENANGKYIGFSDHDDIFREGVLQHCADILKESEVDLLKFGKVVEYIDENGQVTRTDHLGFEDASYTRADLVKNYLSLRQKSLFRFVWDGFFRSELISRHKVQFDRFFKFGGEDHDFCNTFSMFITSATTIKEYYYVHYVRSGFSTSSKTNPDLEKMYEVEGQRLWECLQEINYPINLNLPIYANQLFETVVLPIIRYHFRKKSLKDKQIIEKIENLRKEHFFIDDLNRLTLRDLFKQSKKIGLFSFMFFRKNYQVLFFIIRLRYILMK